MASWPGCDAYETARDCHRCLYLAACRRDVDEWRTGCAGRMRAARKALVLELWRRVQARQAVYGRRV